MTEASETAVKRPPAKGSSLSTCCCIGCYKHLSPLKWVCSAVMFPSRCYLPASGPVPCARGVRKPKHTHTRTQSMMCTYPCKNHTVQQSVSNPTPESNVAVWAQETWTNSLWNIALKTRIHWVQVQTKACLHTCRRVHEEEEEGSVSSSLTRWTLCLEVWRHKQHCCLVKQKEKANTDHFIST